MAARKEMQIREPDLTPLGAMPDRKSLGEHVFEKLRQAIIQGDVDKVEELVREHISKGRETVLKAIEDRPGEL